MSRAVRALVELSLGAGIVAYVFTVQFDSTLEAWIAGTGAALAIVGARLSPRWTGRVLLPLALLAPGLLTLALGRVSFYSHTLWLVPAAAWLIAEEPLAAWSLPRPWRPVLVAWASVVALSWPIVFFRELDFFNWRQVLAFPVSNGLAPGPVWHWLHDIATGAMSVLVGILWCDRLFGRDRSTGSWDRLARDVVVPLGVGFGLASLTALYQAWIDPSWLSFGVWMKVRRAPGTLLDGNGLGIVAAAWSVVLSGFLMATVVSRHGPDDTMAGTAAARGTPWWLAPRVAAMGVLAIGCLAVFASGSRTAFVAYAIGCACVVLAVATTRQRWWLLAAGLAFLAVLTTASQLRILKTDTPTQRLAATLPSPSAKGVDSFVRSLWARDGWGTASVAAIRAHRVTGVGVGTFSRQAVDYYHGLEGALIPADNAQNWWRQEVAEFGIAGALFSCVFSVLVLVLCLRRPPGGRRGPAGAAVCGALIGLGVASLFGVPTQVPGVAFSAWTFLYFAVRLVGRPERQVHPTRWRSAVVGVLAVAVLAVAAGQLYAATHDLRPLMRSIQTGASSGYGYWRGGVAENGDPFWWAQRHAAFVFPFESGIFEFVAIPMHPDIAASPVKVEIWLNGRQIVERVARDHSPIPVRLRTWPGQRAIVLETRVSRTFVGPRGLPLGLMIQKNVYQPVGK